MPWAVSEHEDNDGEANTRTFCGIFFANAPKMGDVDDSYFNDAVRTSSWCNVLFIVFVML